MSGSKLPEFENPPVVETVLGAQFDPITGLQNAHLGLFWQFLQKEWPDGGWTEIDEIPPLEQQAEVFKEKQNWANMGLQLRLTENPANRLRIKNVAQDRMIQIQNGRLHFNWLGGGEYPRYHKVKPGFEKTLEIFKRFLKATFKEEPRFNQWEVTYVNHIPKGELWSDPSDWYKVVNIVPKPAPIEAPLKFDAIASNWQFTIEPELGRLYVQLNHAFLHDKKEYGSASDEVNGTGSYPGWDGRKPDWRAGFRSKNDYHDIQRSDFRERTRILEDQAMSSSQQTVDILGGSHQPLFLVDHADSLAEKHLVEHQQEASAAQGWESIIKELRKWLFNPDLVDIEDADPPSRQIISKAIELAQEFKQKEFSAPLRVLPDLEGGIVFERREGDYYETVTLNADIEVEIERYEKSVLISSDKVLLRR